MIGLRAPALSLAALSFWLLFATAEAAGAQPDAAGAPGTSEAAELFKQGKEHYGAGRYVESHEAYQRAWALQKGYDIAGNLGNVEVKLGRYREAVKHLQFALDHLPPSLTGDKRELVVQKMGERLAAAKARVAIVRLAGLPDGAQVSLDDEAMGSAPLAEPFIVDPGPHRITVSLAGYRTQEHQLTATAGSNETLRLTLAESGPAQQSDEPAGASVPLIVAGSAVALVAIGVGGALLGVSAGKGDEGTRIRQDIEANFPPGSCSTAARTADSALDARCGDLDNAIDAEGVFFGSGLGLLIGGGVLGVATLTYALWPRDDDDADAASTSHLIVVPAAGPGFAGLTLSGRF